MEKAEAADDLQLVARLLEQAARECGDAYTNRQRVAVKTSDNPVEAAGRQEFSPTFPPRSTSCTSVSSALKTDQPRPRERLRSCRTTGGQCSRS
jgi:hypothetical protein